MVLLSAAINVAVDPYGYFGSPRIEGINELKPAAATRVRAVKPHAIPRVKPRTIIVGNSRPEMGIDPESPYWPDSMRPVYNLSLPGEDLLDQARQAEEALDSANATTLVWAVDFLDFLRDPNAPPGMGTDSDNETTDHFSDVRTGLLALLSAQALSDSLWTVVTQVNENSETRTELGFNPANDYKSTIKVQGAYVLFKQKREYLRHLLGRAKWTVLDDGTPTSREFEAIRKVLRFSRDRNKQVIVLINPYHSDYMRIIDERGYAGMFEIWRKTLISVIAESPDTALWDFSTRHAYSDEPAPSQASREPLRWFWEPSHYRRELGEIMLARMLRQPMPSEATSFGQLLNGADNCHDQCCENDCFRSASPAALKESETFRRYPP